MVNTSKFNRIEVLLEAHLLQIRMTRKLEHWRGATEQGDGARFVIEKVSLTHLQVDEACGVLPVGWRSIHGVVNLESAQRSHVSLHGTCA